MGVVSRRARIALVLGPTLAGLVSGGVWSARADTPPAPPGAGQVAVAQQSPPTTNLIDGLLHALIPGTTAPPPPTTAPAPPPGGSGGGGGGGGGGPNSPSATPTTTAPGDETIPPEAQAIIDSVVRSGSNNDLALLAALQPLADQGLTAEEAAVIGMGQFPVAGEAYWSDDFLTARFTPYFHLHQGNDIFAARGTPVRAPAAGTLRYASEDAGGLAAYVTTGDGTYYYMAHLDRFADNISSGASVKQGQVVGFVGNTGDAAGGATHCHFEIHPGGGAAVDPKPYLDRWVTDAIAHVPDLLGTYRTSSVPRPITDAGLLRRLDSGSLGAPVSTDGPGLWTTSVERDSGGVRLTQVASEGDDGPFDPTLRGARAKAVDWLRAQQMANDVLDPLTPKVM
jgi:murein DD-endopeptidase MepM/ murein hydrolase activator NlpD